MQVHYLNNQIMETTYHTEAGRTAASFLSRLGYRELNAPKQYNCIRNGEPLLLTVRLFENTQTEMVIYFTEAVYIPSGKLRHTTLFRFNAGGDHEGHHKYCLHALFFDERMGELFEQENKFNPPAHLDAAQAEQFHSWVRLYWNSNYFATRYKELGGLDPEPGISLNC